MKPAGCDRVGAMYGLIPLAKVGNAVVPPANARVGCWGTATGKGSTVGGVVGEGSGAVGTAVGLAAAAWVN